jgi:hypothetical protein
MRKGMFLYYKVTTLCFINKVLKPRMITDETRIKIERFDNFYQCFINTTSQQHRVF